MNIDSTDIITAMTIRKKASKLKPFDADAFINGYIRFLEMGSIAIGVLVLVLMVAITWIQVSK